MRKLILRNREKPDDDEQKELRRIVRFILVTLNRKLISKKIFAQLPENFQEQLNFVVKIDSNPGIFKTGWVFDLSPDSDENITEIFSEDKARIFKGLDKRIDKLLNRFQSRLSLLTLSRLTEISVGISSGNIPVIGNIWDFVITLDISQK